MAERLAKELSTTDGGSGGDGKQPDDEEIRETTFFRLDSLGYRVGQGLAERYVHGFIPLCFHGYFVGCFVVWLLARHFSANRGTDDPAIQAKANTIRAC